MPVGAVAIMPLVAFLLVALFLDALLGWIRRDKS